MTKIGEINLTQKYATKGDNFYDVRDEVFMDFSKIDPLNAQIILDDATSREVKPLVDSVKAAIKKNDVPFVYPNDKDETYSLAKKYARRYLGKYLRQPPSFPPEYSEHEYNGNASAGIIGKKTGFPKTSDYLESKPYKEYSVDIDHIPIQLVNHKDEFLDMATDLSRNKVRLVDCVDKSFLHKQKVLYHNQNKAFAEDWKDGFIKYGMVKQYGGLNVVVIQFEGCYLVSLSDCSGYDKVAVLTDVYEFRNEEMIDVRRLCGDGYQDFIDAIKEYVTYYTLNPIRAHFDGSILLQKLSNSSGQNNTTNDNSILHVIMKFDTFITIWFEKYGHMPSYQECMENMVLAIYSDDKVFGIKFPFDTDRYKEIETKVYGKYGMVIKASASKVIEHVPGERFADGELEFLGSTAIWCPDLEMYLPSPRIGKLCTSLTRVLTMGKKLSRPELFGKVFSIYSLLHAVNPQLQNAVRTYLNYVINRDDSTNEDMDEFTNIMGEFFIDPSNVNDRSAFNYLMTGQQCSGTATKLLRPNEFLNKSGGFLFFLHSVGWLEGFKNIMKAVLAEKKIEIDCEKTGISAAGCHYIQCALDPFSDIAVDCDGYPDRFTGKSVVQKVKTQYTISAPSGVAGNWDANVYFDKIVSQHDVNWFTTNVNIVDGVSGVVPANGTNRGGVEVRSGAAGATLDDGSVVSAASVALALPAEYLSSGGVRVIGAAFEAINSTAPLNRQGNVIVWRDNDNGDDFCTINIQTLGGMGGTDVVSNAFRTIEAPDIPMNATQALNFYDSKKWEAEQGAYCVATLKQDGIPFEEFDTLPMSPASTLVAINQFPIGYLNPHIPASATPKNIAFSSVTNATGTGARFPSNNSTNVSIQRPILTHQFNTTGAYFTGLSPTTTIDIVVHWIIERAPNENNKDLVVLTRRSAGFDPKALELYGRVAGFLPPGVPRGDNDIGDWITEVADVLHELGVPGMGLVKGAVNGGKMMYNAYNGLSNQKYANPNSSNKASPGMNVKRKNTNQKAKQNATTMAALRRENAAMSRAMDRAIDRGLPPLPKLPGQASKNAAKNRRRKLLKKNQKLTRGGGLFLG